MHARGETLDVKPTWKHAFEHGRGVVWASRFNIGEEIAPGKVKQWVCRRADGAPLAIAVIWERWEHPQKGVFQVFVPVTTDSPPSVHSRDDRFPLLFSMEEDVALWLGETGVPPAEIKSLIRMFEGELIVEEEKKPTAPLKAAKRDDQPGLF
jgi:putative SOS response-associated peptidase YedK